MDSESSVKNKIQSLLDQTKKDPESLVKTQRKNILKRCRAIKNNIISGKDPFGVIQIEFLNIIQLIGHFDVDPFYRRCDQLNFCEIIFKFCHRIQKQSKQKIKQILNTDYFYNFFEKKNFEISVKKTESYVFDFIDCNKELLTVDEIYRFIISLTILYLYNEFYNSLPEDDVKLIDLFVPEKLENIRDNFIELGFTLSFD